MSPPRTYTPSWKHSVTERMCAIGTMRCICWDQGIALQNVPGRVATWISLKYACRHPKYLDIVNKLVLIFIVFVAAVAFVFAILSFKSQRLGGRPRPPLFRFLCFVEPCYNHPRRLSGTVQCGEKCGDESRTGGNSKGERARYLVSKFVVKGSHCRYGASIFERKSSQTTVGDTLPSSCEDSTWRREHSIRRVTAHLPLLPRP